MRQGDRHSPSVARALEPGEIEDLRALGPTIPLSHRVVIEPPYGQLALTPRAEGVRYYRVWVVDPVTMRIGIRG